MLLWQNLSHKEVLSLNMECLARRRGKRIENTINNKTIMKREETTAQKKPELARAFFYL